MSGHIYIYMYIHNCRDEWGIASNSYIAGRVCIDIKADQRQSTIVNTLAGLKTTLIALSTATWSYRSVPSKAYVTTTPTGHTQLLVGTCNNGLSTVL